MGLRVLEKYTEDHPIAHMETDEIARANTALKEETGVRFVVVPGVDTNYPVWLLKEGDGG